MTNDADERRREFRERIDPEKDREPTGKAKTKANGMARNKAEVLECASTLVPENHEWLWLHWLARGELHLIAADSFVHRGLGTAQEEVAVGADRGRGAAVVEIRFGDPLAAVRVLDVEAREPAGEPEPWMTTIGHGPEKLPVRFAAA